jgi:hypothetical protein
VFKEVKFAKIINALQKNGTNPDHQKRQEAIINLIRKAKTHQNQKV